jgi:hypothetical protein
MTLSYDWLKGLFRYWRRGGPRSVYGYLTEDRIFRLIRCYPLTYQQDPQEVHVLVGHSRIPMLLWMITSLIVASKTRWSFVVHDDGTLRDADEALLATNLPGCRVIRAAKADTTMHEVLQDFPLLASYRTRHVFGKRLTDFAHFARSKSVVSIDSDILFFRDPTMFLGREALQPNRSVFLCDVKDTSLISPDVFAAKTGRELATPVNAGMFAIPKNFMDLHSMENIMSNFSLMDGTRDSWFIEQTVLGALASLKGSVSLLPADYVQSLEETSRGDAVMRHYVGQVRHLFYSEGLPSVAKMLRRATDVTV